MQVVRLIQAALQTALTGLVEDEAKLRSFVEMVKPAQSLEHGDYQINVAMALGKLLGKPPREVAQLVVDRLPLGDLLESPTIAGPGFINLKLKNEWIAKQVQAMAQDERLGVGLPEKSKTYVVDYSGPNVAKPLHVGHLRSTIIGESLCRILRFAGHKAIGDNHLGDWGTQFGMLIWGYKNLLNAEKYAEDPVRELASLYVEVRKLAATWGMIQTGFERSEASSSNPELLMKDVLDQFVSQMKRSRKQIKKGEEEEDEAPAKNLIIDAYRHETVKIHQGDAENLRLWKEFMPACMEEVHAIYKRLDVHFDYELGESFYNPMLASVVDQMIAKGIAQESKGALIYQEKEGSMVTIIRKGDGAFTYTTTDLATIEYRAKEFKPDAVWYVVDFRQGDHFKNLFQIAKKWGYTEIDLKHVSFGSVLDETKKPIKTRDGKAIELHDLLDEAIRNGGAKYEETRQERIARGEELAPLSAEEIAEIAHTVGLGAVKYADLSQNRTSDYVFSFEKMLATDGNTATYMQYAYVRCRGIFRKGEVDEQALRATPPLPQLLKPEERALALQLIRFESVLEQAIQEAMPHVLTGYLWDLAKSYSSFFVACPVLKPEEESFKPGRLLLVDLTARMIRLVLQLLGIRVVERM
jgi:arginyl-tRNA synthetase